MAAAGDAPAGLFSGVWSRLHTAASFWRRRGQSPGNGDGGDEEEEEAEAAVRSRLAKRAAAARRLGRKLAFVSFNLEVLVFVYAFWRARRRSLSWRLPTQALPILVVPALATLIYAAFVRFTRTLDLKDKKRLERLEEDKQQTDAEPRELVEDKKNDVQNCDVVDGASNSSVAADSVPHTPRLRKRRQPSMDKRDDGGADMAWGHSKDFKPMPSDGLRHRTFSGGKAYMANSSSTESTEQNTQKTSSVSTYSDQHVHVPMSVEDTVLYPSDDHSGSAVSSILAQPANIPEELPTGDGERKEEFDGFWGITDTCSSSSKENLVPPAGPHNSFCDRDDSHSSELAIATAFQELLVKVSEGHSLSLPEKLESSPVFIEKANTSPPDSCLSDSSPDLSDPAPPASETLKELPAEGVKERALVEPPHTSAALRMYCFTSEDNPTWCAVHDKELKINSDVETYLLPPICSDVQDNAAVVNIDAVNPKWNLLLKLYGNEVEETKLSKFHIPEESTRSKSCLGIPEFSLCSQETKKLEIVEEGSEDGIEEESCELNTQEENDALINMEEEGLQDPPTVSTSTSEQCLEASDVSSCIQDAKAREVPGIINFVTANPELMCTPSSEVLEEDDEEFKEDKTSDLHLPKNDGVSFSFEEEPILDSPVADTAEHFLLTPLYTEEIEVTEVHDVVKDSCFESEDEEAFNHQKLAVTPSNDDSNTRNLTSDSIPEQLIPNTNINDALEGGEEESSEPLHEGACQAEEMFLSSGETSNDEVYSSDSNSYAKLLEGLSKFQEKMPITFSDSPIFLDAVKSAAVVDSDTASPKLSLQTPFNLEEAVVLSPPAVNDGSLFTQLKVICQSAGTPEFSLCNQESKEMEVVGSDSFIKASPELSFLSPPELVVEGGEHAREKEANGLNTEEENVALINLEDEALQGELVVSTADHSLETSEFSLSSQGAKIPEAPEIVSSFAASTELKYPAFPELLVEGDGDLKEDEMSDFPIHEQKGLSIILEEPFLDPLVVDTAEDAVVISELLICSEEVKMAEVHGVIKEVAGSVSFIEDSPELSFLSSPEFVAEGGEDAREKESGGLNTEEENAPLINLEDEALQSELLVSTTDQSLEIEFSLSSQGAKMTEVPGIVGPFTVSPELSYPAFPELLAEGEDELKEDETSDFPLHEQKGLPFNLEEPFLDPVVVDTAEDAVVTSELLICSEEVKITKVHGVVKEVLSVSEDEGTFDHQKIALTSPDDDNTAQNSTSNPVYAQFSPDASEASQAGQEPLSEPPHESTSHSERTFLSSGEINHDEVKSETPFAGQEGPLKSEDEMALTPLDTSILLDEVHGVVKEVLSESDDEGQEGPFKSEDEMALSSLDTSILLDEVHGVFKEVLSESDDEGAFDDQKLVLTSPDDDDTTQTLTGNSISAQFIRDAIVKEVSQAGYEPFLELPLESTCVSGAFSSSGEIDGVKAEAPVAGQEGLFKSENEMASSLDTSILLDEVRSAETFTDNSASSLSVPNSNGIQALHDHEQDPSESLQEVTSPLEGSHTSSDEGISSGNFSLYSRSSSCVSDINMLETLRGGTSSEPQNDRDISFDERHTLTFPNMDSAESNTNDPAVTAEFILETNMIETLNSAEEANVGSPHEDSSNFLGTFVAPDVINDMTESDKHLDLSSSSFAPVVDVFESLQTGQGFSELQHEEDFTVQETQMSPKEGNNAENYCSNTIWVPEDRERTSIVASQDEDALTHHRVYMSPEDVSDVENSLADDYASDIPHTVESHFFSEKLSPESQDPLSFEEILVYPDEGSNTENDLGSANSSLCSREVSLAEPLGIDQEGTPQHDETMLGSEYIFMVDQEANSENLCNNSGSLDIPDIIMADSLQGADIVSSEILYDGMSSFEGTLLSFDGDDSAEEDSPNNSGSVTHTAQINTASLPDLQEESFKPEDEKTINSISPYEVDTEETTYSSVLAKDTEPEHGECKDMKEDVEDLEDDHESNPIGTFGVDEITASLAPKPSVELYANDAPWRDSALIGTSYDFDMAVRKPVVTISGSNGISTIFELADVQYTALDDDDDDTETLGAPLPHMGI